jgi:Ribosomal protein L11 methylase
VVNGQENAENNHCTNIHLQQGKISEVNLTGKFDIILANINKNILLAEMDAYASFLPKGGRLLLSGFYTHDIDDLKQRALPLGLTELNRDERESWATLLLTKNT